MVVCAFHTDGRYFKENGGLHTAERETSQGGILMAVILWECNDCIPGCKLTAHIDLDDPPEGCPWAHQNTEDPNRCNWKAKKVLE